MYLIGDGLLQVKVEIPMPPVKSYYIHDDMTTNKFIF